MRAYAEVGVAFASALVEGNFAGAESLLAPDLQRQWGRDALRQMFYGMFRGYAEGEPRRIHFDPRFQREDWPSKRPGDIGWVYVGIEGDDFAEAVSVVVASVENRLLIREVEWGRP